MPKLFTAKDFIAYNNPCFSCGSQIALRLGIINLQSITDTSYLETNVSKDLIDINLHITYYDTLTLSICHRTNEFSTNSINNLTMYLGKHHIFLQSYCDYCKSKIETKNLQFDLMNDKVLAIQLNSERFLLKEGQVLYHLISDFSSQKSVLLVDDLSSTNPALPLDIDLPLLPKYSFNNRETLLKKIKTYATFA